MKIICKTGCTVREKDILKSRGITLVALVITIIVLIILAAIALNFILGDNGILKKANIAKQNTNYTTSYEEIKMLVLETQAEHEGKVTLEHIVEKLKKDTKYEYIIKFNSGARLSKTEGDIKEDTENISELMKEKKEIYVIHKGYEFKIDENLNINSTKQIGGENGATPGNPDSSKNWKTVSGTIDATQGFYYKNYSTTEKTPISLDTTMTYSTTNASDLGGRNWYFPTIDTNLEYIKYIKIDFDSSYFWCTYHDTTRGYTRIGRVALTDIDSTKKITGRYGNNLEEWEKSRLLPYADYYSLNTTVSNIFGITLSIEFTKDKDGKFLINTFIDTDHTISSNSSYAFNYKVYMVRNPTWEAYGY